MKKRLVALLFLLAIISLIVVPFVSAGPIREAFSGMNIWDMTKKIFTGSFLKTGADIKTTFRIAFFIFVFSVTWAVFNMLGRTNQFSWLGGRIAVVLALVFAGISTLFTPYKLLVGIGADWALIGLLIFAGIPIGLFVWGAIYFSRAGNYWLAALFIIIIILIADYIMGAVQDVENYFMKYNVSFFFVGHYLLYKFRNKGALKWD